MKTLTFFLCATLAVAGALQAQTLIHSTNWTTGSYGSTTAGAAGTTTGAGDNWTDVYGGIFKLYTAVSPDRLIMTVSGSVYANDEVLLRPASETSSVRDQGLAFSFDYSASATLLGVLRWQSGNTSYEAGINNGVLHTYRVASGVLSNTTGTNTTTLSPAPSAGDVVQLTITASGANPTTLTVTAYDTTTNTSLGSVTNTDSTGPQVAGQIGIQAASSSVLVTQAATYNEATPATSYTLTPATATDPSGQVETYTVAPNGTYSGTISLSSAGVSGTLSVSSLTFSSNLAQTFTFTPTAPNTGTTTISGMSSPALGADQSATLTVGPPLISIPVNSAAVHWSPGNWAGDTGRGGSVYRRTWYPGAYCTFYWSTTSSSPTAAITITNAGGSANNNNCDFTYVMDGVEYDNILVPASGAASLTVSGAGSHVCTVYCRNSNEAGRWNETTAWTISNFQVDSSSTLGMAPTFGANNWVMEVGDSITEGIYAYNGANDNLYDYSYLLGQALLAQSFDYSVFACGDSGWLTYGDTTSDVPVYYSVTGSSGGTGGTYSASASRWWQIDSTTSLLDANGQISSYGATGTAPAMITVNYGVNDCLQAVNVSNLEASITGFLTAARAAAPNAWLVVYIPPEMYSASLFSAGLNTYIPAIRTGVANYQTANPLDRKAVLLDFGPALSNLVTTLPLNGVHPETEGHAVIAAQFAAALLPKLLPIRVGEGFFY